jgi:hypothetical protein
MDYGNRPDGSEKGMGFFGELKRPDGNISTEISVGVGIDGKEIDIPLIVPSLTKKELNYLLSTDIKSKSFFNNMPPSIMDKAYEHANTRIKSGMSPFAGPDEIVEAPIK